MELNTMDDLNKFDITAGSLIRTLLRGTSKEEKQELYPIMKRSQCVPFILFIGNKENGKGGFWYYKGKIYFLDSFSGLREGDSEFYDIRCFKKHFEEKSFLRNILEEVANGERKYELVWDALSYVDEDIANTAFDYNSEVLANSDFKEITYNDYELIFDERNRQAWKLNN